MSEKLIRNCPVCNKVLYYKSEYRFKNAIKNNSLCCSCIYLKTEKISITQLKEKLKKKLKEKYTKKCPQCKKVLKYKTKDILMSSIRKKSICKECYYQNRIKSIGPFERECPICKKILIYKKYSSFYRANKENSKCINCSEKRKPIFTIKEKKEKSNKNSKRYYHNNKKRIKEYKKIYQQKSETKERERIRSNKRRKDPVNRLNHNISVLIRLSLKSKNISKNRRHWEDLVGYSVLELKEHLEKLFKPGMSWENRSEWHIDHIIPISFFQYKDTDDTEFKYCWSLNNLQPLWAEKNLSKADTVLKNSSLKLITQES